MQRQVANPLAEQVLSGDIIAGDRVQIGVSASGDALAFAAAGEEPKEEAPEDGAEAVAA